MALHTSFLHRLDALDVIAWNVYSFELPLIAGGTRKGLLVSIKNSEGNTQWGEIAPYPGRSQETLELAAEQLIAFLSGKNKEELFPSVQCGLEHALAPLNSPTSAALYAFLSGSYEQVMLQAERAADLNYTTVKVKLSPFSVPLAQTLLTTLQQRFRLRVDCNSAYAMNEALTLFSSFDPAYFDYIEDPSHERHRLHEFTHPLALDETVTEYRKLPLETYPHLYGFILKPTILGGKKGCAPYIEFAKKNQLKVVFSPAFESGLGLLQIVSVAKHFNLLGDLIGLDTHRYLQYDLLDPSINFSTPTIHLTEAPCINLKFLKEIARGTNHLPHF